VGLFYTAPEPTRGCMTDRQTDAATEAHTEKVCRCRADVCDCFGQLHTHTIHELRHCSSTVSVDLRSLAADKAPTNSLSPKHPDNCSPTDRPQPRPLLANDAIIIKIASRRRWRIIKAAAALSSVATGSRYALQKFRTELGCWGPGAGAHLAGGPIVSGGPTGKSLRVVNTFSSRVRRRERGAILRIAAVVTALRAPVHAAVGADSQENH